MTSHVPGIMRRALVGLTDAACRFPRLVVTASVLLTIASLWFVGAYIAIDTSTDEMLSSDLPHRRLDRELNAAFPKDPDQLVVVVEATSQDLADDAGLLFAEVLRSRPDLFHTVFDPAGDPFFRKNGLLYPEIDDLYELSDRLAAAQPFLGALWRDQSLRGLFGMLSLAVEETAKGNTGASGEVDITGVLDAVSEIAEAQIEGRYAQLSWMQLMTGADSDGRARRFILVQPILDYAELRPAETAIDTIRSIAADLAYDGSRGVRVRLTGSVALNDDELQSVTLGMGAAGFISLALVLTLLMIGLRSPRTTLAALVTLVFGLIWTAAFAVATIGSLNLISVAFAVLFIGLSVDFSIHYALRYREEWEHAHDPAANLHATVKGVGGALTLSAIAAAIGFVSFVPTDYVGLAELGVIAAGGMIIALFANLTLLPALIMLLRPQLRKPVHWETDLQARIATVVSARAKPVAVVALALGLGAAALLPKAHFDFDPLNLKDPESDSVRALLDLMADDPTQGYAAYYLAEDLDAADALAARLVELPLVHSTRTLSSFVPGDQPDKLDAIATLALILEPSLMAQRMPSPIRADTVSSLRELQEALRTLDQEGDATTQAAAQRLLAALGVLARKAVADPGVWRQLQTRLLSRLPRRLDMLRDSLQPETVTAANLPELIHERWIAIDGRARMEIYPKESIHRDPDALRAFLGEVRTVVPNAVGAPVEVLEGGRAVVRSFLEAAGLAVIGITILLLVMLRNFFDTLVVFAPLILAALLTIAASVLLDLPFNFANVIVLPLLFGLGVAGSLHLVVRERKEGRRGDVMSTSTPRAVMFSTLTTIASFVSLSLSAHPGTASMGVLLTIALILTMLCTLIVLPAVMTLAHRNLMHMR